MNKTKDSVFQRRGAEIYCALFALLLLGAVAGVGRSLVLGRVADSWAPFWMTLAAAAFGLMAIQASDVRAARREALR
jgi:hypothetical protein